jgi:hypothetical protein
LLVAVVVAIDLVAVVALVAFYLAHLQYLQTQLILLQLVVAALAGKAILLMVQLDKILYFQQLALMHLVVVMVDMKVSEVVMVAQVAALAMGAAYWAESELLVKEIMVAVDLILLV